MGISPWDIDSTLMMHPALNKILRLSDLHLISASKSVKRNRAMLASTALYHIVLDKMFKESSIVRMIRGKPQYQKRKYLGNIEIEYIPDHAAWKVTITNGGKKRKNAKLQYEIMETLYIRKLQGIYIVDDEFRVHVKK